RRGRRHRVGVRDPRAGTPDGGRRAGARLPDGAGGDPVVLRRVRADQPARRPDLHLPRSADPVLSTLAGNASIAVLDAAPPTLPTVARRMVRSRSILIGGAMLALVVLMAVLAPLLGTTDPSQVEPVLRNKRPGTART